MYVHLCQKAPFVVACFQASAAPRPENSDSDDALFGLGTQITTYLSNHIVKIKKLKNCFKIVEIRSTRAYSTLQIISKDLFGIILFSSFYHELTEFTLLKQF
jgi:hypothetical protein